MFWSLGGKGSLGHSLHLINELMNYEGVCRTAPATPGLLIIMSKTFPDICAYQIRLLACSSECQRLTNKQTQRFKTYQSVIF